MHCIVCHATLETNARFCSSCGSAVASAATGPTQRLDQPPARFATTLRGGVCPQCASTAVFVKTNALIQETETQPIKLHVRAIRNIMSSSVISAPINIFLCAECGYMELYLADGDVLEQVKRNVSIALRQILVCNYGTNVFGLVGDVC